MQCTVSREPGPLLPRRNRHPTAAARSFSPECEHGANAGLAIARGLLEPLKAKFPWIRCARTQCVERLTSNAG